MPLIRRKWTADRVLGTDPPKGVAPEFDRRKRSGKVAMSGFLGAYSIDTIAFVLYLVVDLKGT